jgi:hypothetical protein
MGAAMAVANGIACWQAASNEITAMLQIRDCLTMFVIRGLLLSVIGRIDGGKPILVEID